MNTPESQVWDDMPSCDDCTLVFQNIYDQRKNGATSTEKIAEIR